PGEVLSGSGLVVDDAITWRKGEVLGRGAYGTVNICLLLNCLVEKEKSHHSKENQSCQHPKLAIVYVPGGSIASVLHRFGPLPERVLALYTRQILEGVSYLHLNRVIHRDLKGNNVMLMPTGVVKLIDFGCARRLRCLTHTYSHSDLLKSVHGTPYWMAPEVINETGHGRKSDIWSVGCTVFEMATGKPPLSHMDKMAALPIIKSKINVTTHQQSVNHDNKRASKLNNILICPLCSDQKQRPSAEQLLDHPFIPNNVILV
uniref:Mitogen-activated protein kinase kinase kinase 19 n=1 Tax=Oncorhynchus mykiss TaxID=8022 RepID=A0A8C7PXD3_ONCMY